MSAGANGHGLISGSTKATVTYTDDEGFWSETDTKQIAPGNKGSVTESGTGRDNKDGDATGYVHGWDVHDWEHTRKHDVDYSGFQKKVTKNKISHTIEPPP